MTEQAKSNVSRQASFRKRQRDAGLVYMHVWVPEKDKDELNAFVAWLNKGKPD